MSKSNEVLKLENLAEKAHKEWCKYMKLAREKKEQEEDQKKEKFTIKVFCRNCQTNQELSFEKGTEIKQTYSLFHKTPQPLTYKNNPWQSNENFMTCPNCNTHNIILATEKTKQDRKKQGARP